MSSLLYVGVAMQLMIVDDDEVSREVLCLLGEAEGHAVTAVDSGDAALAAVAGGARPDAILTDMQMPGITGTALAEALRAACPGARLIGMSASGDGAAGFDGFLRKPFEMADLAALLGKPALDAATFASLAGSMGAAQRKALYAFCLDDAERRIARMREARAAGDGALYVREAHAIKGGCGMVGATELHALADAMETSGISPDETSGTGMDPLDGFLAASARLRRILDVQDS
jgi:CheY-like chemotaxis protein